VILDHQAVETVEDVENVRDQVAMVVRKEDLENVLLNVVL
jgi:hypothetical protein